MNGVNLAVEVRGEGPAVLFVHGYPLDRTIWRDQIDALEGYRRIAPDLRGMGQSDAPDLGYGMAIYADDLAALLDALGVDDVVLCGLSMGGYVVFEFLRRWRDRVRALVLHGHRAPRRMRPRRAAPATRPPPPPANAAPGPSRTRMLPKMLAPDTERARARGRSSGSARSWPRRRWPGWSARWPPCATGTTAPACCRPSPVCRPWWSWARKTRSPRRTRPARMAAAIPGARLVVIPSAGHLPPVEQPDETTAAIRGIPAAWSGETFRRRARSVLSGGDASKRPR